MVSSSLFSIGSLIKSQFPEPFDCPAIYDWLQTCLITRNLAPFMTLAELVSSRSLASSKSVWDLEQWTRLTPRTLLFVKFFATMRADWSSAQCVEGLFSAGIDLVMLETLPEAVLAPLQEAVVQCQKEPPTTWSKDLLAIVGREDVNMLLTPGQRPRHPHTTLLVTIIPRFLTNLTVSRLLLMSQI